MPGRDQVRIRLLAASDLGAAGDLLRQLGYAIDAGDLAARMARVRAAPDHCAVVAELDGRIVGLLHVFERPALEKPCEALVQALVVDEASRGRGVGRALMTEAERWAMARGLASVILHTRADRKAAQAFYAGIGYECAATSHLLRKMLTP